jgi:hypothetical protein
VGSDGEGWCGAALVTPRQGGGSAARFAVMGIGYEFWRFDVKGSIRVWGDSNADGGDE